MTPEDTIELYKELFTTVQGERVLDDLGMRFCEHSSTFSSDPHETAYREGQRTVVLFIKSMLRDRKQLEGMTSDE
tara:strand:+ start:2725 stop:2949 length:225 start_codon:yes stop_codon:yes gene_type:complete